MERSITGKLQAQTGASLALAEQIGYALTPPTFIGSFTCRHAKSDFQLLPILIRRETPAIA